MNAVSSLSVRLRFRSSVGDCRTFLCSASAVKHWPEFVDALCWVIPAVVTHVRGSCWQQSLLICFCRLCNVVPAHRSTYLLLDVQSESNSTRSCAYRASLTQAPHRRLSYCWPVPPVSNCQSVAAPSVLILSAVLSHRAGPRQASLTKVVFSQAVPLTQL
jgi:hypothetical protein